MSANVMWTVRVMRLTTDEVEVSAVTETEALQLAAQVQGVALVVGVVRDGGRV